MRPTLCVVRTANNIWGMFTDIAWKDSGKNAAGESNSFVFKFDGNNIKVYPCLGLGPTEVTHSSQHVFAMMGGPVAITQNRRASAVIGQSYVVPRGENRWTLLCGEREPEVHEVEIFHMN